VTATPLSPSRWSCQFHDPTCTTRNPCSDGCRPVAPDRASNPFLRPPPTENQP